MRLSRLPDFFQDAESLIETYKARVSYFYGANVDSVNFANIEEEIAGRLNQDIEQQQVISADSPLALVSGNYFQVVCCFVKRQIFSLKIFPAKI